MVKVCIANAHYSNRGDEAALLPIIRYLLSLNIGIDITIIFKDRNEIQGFPYSNEQFVHFFSAQFLPDSLEEIEYAISKYKNYVESDKNSINCSFTDYISSSSSNSSHLDLYKIVEACMDSDVIVYAPGGAVISNRFWWRKQLEYLIPFVCAISKPTPIVVAAPSMGPFSQDEHANIIRKYLSFASCICVREPISASYLAKIGIENVITTIDTAFYDDPVLRSNEKILMATSDLNTFLSSHDKIVGITLTDLKWNVQYYNNPQLSSSIEDTARSFISYLTDNGYGVLLIPQLFGNQNDIGYLSQFSQSDTFILNDRFDTYFQQFIISKCYSLIGMRYHSCIFAAKAATPFIAVGYEEKTTGFMKNWQFDDYLLDISEFNYTNLTLKWNNLVNNHYEYKSALSLHREEWRDLAAKTLTAIKDEVIKS